jgi:hypothetical protein
MKRHETATRWTPKQERVALLIASGKAIKDAAAECGAGERTAHTWLEDPAYRTLIAELRGRLMNQALGKLADAAGEAVGVLRASLADANPNVRLRAAVSILDGLMKMREHVELAEQLADAQRRLAEHERLIEKQDQGHQGSFGRP